VDGIQAQELVVVRVETWMAQPQRAILHLGAQSTSLAGLLLRNLVSQNLRKLAQALAAAHQLESKTA
jgi:hypothetical protein